MQQAFLSTGLKHWRVTNIVTPLRTEIFTDSDESY